MSTLTIRLPDTQHERLKAFARTRGVSVNKLVEELANGQSDPLSELDVQPHS